MNKKAISLLSGGLDSTLATKLMVEQGVEVIALHFTSPFCTCSKGGHGCGIQALRSADELGVKVMVRSKGMEYLEIVKSPKHGYGKNMNPCIDCRIFILKETRKVMDEIGASFVITGEVLGQRPMSQHRSAMRRIEKESGLEGLILRPLSAKHFDPTLPEIEGIIDREKLLGITGRGRKLQYELVEAFNLKEFSCPGGGCLLTDPIFARKLKDLFVNNPDFTMKDVVLLKTGRHFRLGAYTKLILGRNQNENESLVAYHMAPLALLTPSGFKGPTGLLIGVSDDTHLEIAANMMAYYGKRNTFPVSIEVNNGTTQRHAANKRAVDFEGLMI
jgi:tRNA U34 2-thiouridine synthase MnmA/TrmU